MKTVQQTVEGVLAGLEASIFNRFKILGERMADDDALETIESELLEPLRDRADRDQRRALESLIERGLSPTQALDYYMVELGDHTATSWSDVRDCSTQAIWESVERARTDLDD